MRIFVRRVGVFDGILDVPDLTDHSQHAGFPWIKPNSCYTAPLSLVSTMTKFDDVTGMGVRGLVNGLSVELGADCYIFARTGRGKFMIK